MDKRYSQPCHIKEEKERFGKGLHSFAPNKTLPVSNSDSTNEVVRLALQKFGIDGNVKDYQLCVISKRDTPYPLIGHEFPFSIQMSHVREPLAQSSSSKDATPPPDRKGAHVGTHCQFILKPKPVAETQSQDAIDGFNSASAGASGTPGPPQMMGMSGRVGTIGTEGTPNMGAKMMSENGAMRAERLTQAGPMAGRPGVDSPQQQQQQAVPPGAAVPGFGRGSPAVGSFEGPNNKRRRF